MKERSPCKITEAQLDLKMKMLRVRRANIRYNINFSLIAYSICIVLMLAICLTFPHVSGTWKMIDIVCDVLLVITMFYLVFKHDKLRREESKIDSDVFKLLENYLRSNF